MSRLLLRPVVLSYQWLLPLECLSASPAWGPFCAASVARGSRRGLRWRNNCLGGSGSGTAAGAEKGCG